jgi:hypothetical protein
VLDEHHHLLSSADRGDRLVVGELDLDVLDLLHLLGRHPDEGLGERHRPVGCPEVE